MKVRRGQNHVPPSIASRAEVHFQQAAVGRMKGMSNRRLCLFATMEWSSEMAVTEERSWTRVGGRVAKR